MFKISIAAVSTSLVFAAEAEGHNDHDLAFKRQSAVMTKNMKWATGAQMTSNDLQRQLNVVKTRTSAVHQAAEEVKKAVGVFNAAKRDHVASLATLLRTSDYLKH